MTREIKKQMDGFKKEMEKKAMAASSWKERAEIYGFWAGFLNAMKMTGVITEKEYRRYYNAMDRFCKAA